MLRFMNIRFEYVGGMTVEDRVTVDSLTGEVALPKRLIDLTQALGNTEKLINACIFKNDYVVPLETRSNGVFTVSIREINRSTSVNPLYAITHPSKSQRQLNGRFAHMLSAAALIAATLEAYGVHVSTAKTVFETGVLVFLGFILAIAGTL